MATKTRRPKVGDRYEIEGQTYVTYAVDDRPEVWLVRIENVRDSDDIATKFVRKEV